MFCILSNVSHGFKFKCKCLSLEMHLNANAFDIFQMSDQNNAIYMYFMQACIQIPQKKSIKICNYKLLRDFKREVAKKFILSVF